MEVQNLNKYFDDKILRRGFNYYKAKNVKKIYQSGNVYEAIVQESMEYQVTIDISNKDYKLSCTCPYGNYCKHEAAVLYCLKNDSLEVKKGCFKAESDKLSPLEKFQKNLENEIKSLNYEYSDYDNYDYYNEYDYYENAPEMSEDEETAQYADFANTIRFYSNESISEFSDNNDNLITAFKLLISAVDSCEMTTVNYSSSNLYQVLIESYEDLLNDKEFFARLLSTLVDLRSANEKYFYDYIDKAICENISTKWQAEYLISYLNDIEKITDNPITRKIKIIYDFINKETALKEAEENKYLCDRTILDWLLDIYKNNIPKQIELLEKYCNQIDSFHSYDYYQRLLKLYKISNISKYKEALLNYFKKHPNFDNYLELKNTLTKEEWVKVKADVLEKVKDDHSLYCNICVEEKDYQRLLNFLKSGSIGLITQYIDKLINIYPKELLELYTSKLVNFITHAKNPAAYKTVSYYFNYLLKFPNGKEEILRLIGYIKVTYPTRKAFQTEMEFYKDTYL